MTLRGRVPHKPPVPTLVPPRRGISSTAPQHKEKPGSATAPENNSLNRASSRVNRTTNTKKSKKEPIPLAEIKRMQKMSVEELKEVILSAGYELPDCRSFFEYFAGYLTTLHLCVKLTNTVILQGTCTWPDDYDPEGGFMERMEKSIKNRARRERREQRKKGEQSEQKGSRRGGRWSGIRPFFSSTGCFFFAPAASAYRHTIHRSTIAQVFGYLSQWLSKSLGKLERWASLSVSFPCCTIVFSGNLFHSCIVSERCFLEYWRLVCRRTRLYLNVARTI